MSETAKQDSYTRSGYVVTLPAGSRRRADGTSTCPKTHGGAGSHFWIINQHATAFHCECGARAEYREDRANAEK